MRLVYLSPVNWDSFDQRPHFFVRWFHARTGAEILWVDPYPTRLPSFSDFGRSGRFGTAFQNVKYDWLTVIKPPPIPIDPLPGSGVFQRNTFWRGCLKCIRRFSASRQCWLVIGKPSKFALCLLRDIRYVRSVFDAMDDFHLFYNGISRLSMAKIERELFAKVDNILVSSRNLLSRIGLNEHKAMYVPNACAVERLPEVETISRSVKEPVIGYVGTMGKWFDWSVLRSLGEANYGIRIKLIGPVFSKPAKPLPDNIEFFPQCIHDAAIREMRKFSVGLIPFKRSALTASVDPIKYYEYRALGVPVVSTAFGEMESRARVPGVFLVAPGQDLEEIINDAMRFSYALDEIREFRRNNSWHVRFDQSKLLRNL